MGCPPSEIRDGAREWFGTLPGWSRPTDNTEPARSLSPRTGILPFCGLRPFLRSFAAWSLRSDSQGSPEAPPFTLLRYLLATLPDVRRHILRAVGRNRSNEHRTLPCRSRATNRFRRENSRIRRRLRCQYQTGGSGRCNTSTEPAWSP